jgi:hypothetical protein
MNTATFFIYTLYAKGTFFVPFFIKRVKAFSSENSKTFLNFFCISYFFHNKKTKSWTVLKGPSRHKKSREQFGFFISTIKIRFSLFFQKKINFLLSKLFKVDFLIFFYTKLIFLIPYGVLVYLNLEKRFFFKNSHTLYHIRTLKTFSSFTKSYPFL